MTTSPDATYDRTDRASRPTAETRICSGCLPEHWPSGRSCSQAVTSRHRGRVRAGGCDEALRHPIVDVIETLEAAYFVLDDVEEGAPVELHVGEVLEQDVDRLDVRTLELLAS